MMDDIKMPEEWSIAFYGDIYLSASNGIGGTQNKDGVGIPVSRIETIAEQRIDYNRVGYLSSFDEDKIKKHELQQDDILFSHINTPVHLGKTAIYDGIEKLYHGINLLRIVVDKSVFSPKLLNYHCKYTRALGVFSLNAQHAVNQSSLNQKKLSTFKIPLPPLAEQKEIAERLDTLLAQVEATQEYLTRIPNIIKSFRQSVLAAAVSGKLTEEWRTKNNNKNDKITINSNLSVFRGKALPTLPTNWHWFRFDQVAEIASNLVSPAEYPEAIHIAPNHIESWTGTASGFQTILEDGVTSAKHRFKKGQLIYSKIRPYLAKVVIAEFDGLCSADMYPINSKIDTNYLFRWMLTSDFTEWASNAESRSVLPKINQKDLSQIPVPTPPLDEQTEIVRRVEQLFSYADNIEQQVKATKARVDQLTQAVLAKAFRGELTADWRASNPDLISGDNSATALLKKIKAERQANNAKKKIAVRKKL